jgi:hypothetical protein
MSTLVELRDTLLTIGHPEKLLALADKYLTLFEELGDAFVLPKDHVLVAPILEFYVGDLDGWLKFIKGVRDRLPRGSTEHLAVRDFYKTVYTRAIQRKTRRLLDLAISVALKRGILEDEANAKVRYTKRCIQSWTQRRQAALKSARSSSPTGAINIDHKSDVISEFWDSIEEELNHGECIKA